jgi:hypothetical protein
MLKEAMYHSPDLQKVKLEGYTLLCDVPCGGMHRLVLVLEVNRLAVVQAYMLNVDFSQHILSTGASRRCGQLMQRLPTMPEGQSPQTTYDFSTCHFCLSSEVQRCPHGPGGSPSSLITWACIHSHCHCQDH